MNSNHQLIRAIGIYDIKFHVTILKKTSADLSFHYIDKYGALLVYIARINLYKVQTIE